MRAIRRVSPLLLLLSLSARAQTVPLLLDYDIDSTSYTCAAFCTPVSVLTTTDCPGSGRTERRRVTTSGASSATLTSVNSDAPFRGLQIGDLIHFETADTTGARVQYTRLVSLVTSVDSIDLNAAVTIPAAGVPFVWWKLVAGLDTSSAGWVAFPQLPNSPGVNVVVAFDQINATGGVTYKVETRNSALGTWQSPAIAATANIASATMDVDRIGFNYDPWDQLRICFKIVTADDGDDTGVNAEKITVTMRR